MNLTLQNVFKLGIFWRTILSTSGGINCPPDITQRIDDRSCRSAISVLATEATCG